MPSSLRCQHFGNRAALAGAVVDRAMASSDAELEVVDPRSPRPAAGGELARHHHPGVIHAASGAVHRGKLDAEKATALVRSTVLAARTPPGSPAP